MSAWAIVALASLSLVLGVVVLALLRKDSVRAAVFFKDSGFFLEARNDRANQNHAEADAKSWKLR